MRIFIISMDDPIQTNNFIKGIIDARKDDIIGLAISTKGRLTLSKGQSKWVYLFSLLLIMGPFAYFRSAFRTIAYKLRKKAAGMGLVEDPSLGYWAEKQGVSVSQVASPNSEEFRAWLTEQRPDIVISQCQHILKRDLIDIPSIGVLNRHNALLPKNRGRLTPFWVLYRREKATGVSIHFVNEGIDAGEIIVQKRIEVDDRETFDSLVRKNYEVALPAMLETLDRLENGQSEFMPNDDDEASYNSTPRFHHAWEYRWNRIMGRR